MHPDYIEWLRGFAEHIGGWPTHYLVLDAETTGFSNQDRIWELGWTTVADGQVINQGETQIRLSSDPHIDPYFVRGSLERTRETMCSKGSDWQKVSWGWLDNYGLHPVHVYQALSELLEMARENGYWLAGHNIVKFDLPRVAAQLACHIGRRNPPWQLDQVLDTQALFFGLQLDVFPAGSLSDWYHEIKHTGHGGVKSNQAYCSHLLGVPDIVGHRAMGDSHQCCQMIEACRRLIAGES